MAVILALPLSVRAVFELELTSRLPGMVRGWRCLKTQRAWPAVTSST